MSDNTIDDHVGMRELWVNVIKTAVEDAVRPATGRSKKSSRRTQHARDQARAWLSRPSPDLVEVCNLAGFDPDDVIEKAARAIAHCDELEAQGQRFRKRQRKASQPRKVAKYTHDGLTLTAAEWAQRAGIPKATLLDRLERGIPFDRAIDPTPMPRSSARHLKPRKARTITVNGASKTLSEWCEVLGMSYAALTMRRRRYATHEASIAVALAKRQAPPRGWSSIWTRPREPAAGPRHKRHRI